MTHWARELIGKPWAPDADGPEAFSCWGLVRHVFRMQHGVELPIVLTGEQIASIENIAAIKRAADVSGWRRVIGVRQQPREGDVVLMKGVSQTHVGVVVSLGSGTSVLHSRNRAGVICEPWRQAIEGMRIELWRRA